jgi:hypothetical protein
MKARNQKTIQLHKESLDKIKSNKKTKIVSYEDFKSAFDYVDNMFPNAKVKEATVYMCPRRFLDNVGYKGIGGFYSRVEKIVVIPDSLSNLKDSNIPTNSDRWSAIQSHITIEQILVHELLHYVSGKICETEKTMQIEEEFAYGNMIDFCRMRGKTDDEIIVDIFLPYLFSIIIPNKNFDLCKTDEDDRRLFESVYKESIDLGKRIMKIWDKKNIKPKTEKNDDIIKPYVFNPIRMDLED